MTKLSIQHLYKAYPHHNEGIQVILDDINFEAHEKEFICIVGPSGCGKSTLLNLIAGLVPASHGSIQLNGESIQEPSPNRGMVFQKPSLFPWRTVEDNIKYSADMRGDNQQEEVDQIINMVGLRGYEDYYPRQLSGGMAQRVSLARTMINQPEVFLLDEPLGALDAFTRANLQDELLKLWQTNENLMMMVTHDVEEAVYMATQVLVMKAHPGEITSVIDIDLPYPRNRTSQEFIDYRNIILNKLND